MRIVSTALVAVGIAASLVQQGLAQNPAPAAARNTHSDPPRVVGPIDAAGRPSAGLRLCEHSTGFGLKNSNQRAGLHVSFVFGAFIRRE